MGVCRLPECHVPRRFVARFALRDASGRVKVGKPGTNRAGGFHFVRRSQDQGISVGGEMNAALQNVGRFVLIGNLKLFFAGLDAALGCILDDEATGANHTEPSGRQILFGHDDCVVDENRRLHLDEHGP